MAVRTCPHCGSEVVGTKIKCRVCGRMLGAPPVPDEKLSAGGQAFFHGDESRDLVTGSGGRTAITVQTKGRRVVDITPQVRRFASKAGAYGLIHVFVPHATAGLAMMETGSGSEADLGEVIDRLFPPDDRYAHQHGAKGHGRDHLLPVFVSPFLSIPYEHSELLLGTWQSVVLVDPNESNDERRVILSNLPGGS